MHAPEKKSESLEDSPETAEWAKALTFDQAYMLVYEELHAVARRMRRKDPAATISSVALVNEAWIKLRKSPGLKDLPKDAFMGIAANAMRQVLVEAARKRKAGKRDGGERVDITLSGIAARTITTSDDVLALNEALDKLELVNPMQAKMVGFRFFIGLSVDETASVMKVSPSTIQREWRVVKAWLAATVKTGGHEPDDK